MFGLLNGMSAETLTSIPLKTVLGIEQVKSYLPQEVIDAILQLPDAATLMDIPPQTLVAHIMAIVRHSQDVNGSRGSQETMDIPSGLFATCPSCKQTKYQQIESVRLVY